jgi:hypothetical protein
MEVYDIPHLTEVQYNPLSRKGALIVFWDAEVVLLLDFLERGRGRGERRSINAEPYCEMLT